MSQFLYCPPNAPKRPAMPHNSLMNKTASNPYIAQIYAKGRDYVPTAAPKAEYPRTIYGRTFETEAEYKEALADFLNGM